MRKGSRKRVKIRDANVPARFVRYWMPVPETHRHLDRQHLVMFETA